MVNEPTTTTYSDALISAAIERYPLMDAHSQESLTWDYSTTPPTSSENEDWIPTYDLNSAAAEIWDEKAAAVASNYSFSADGANLSRGDVVKNYERQAAKFRARGAVKAIPMVRKEHMLTEDGQRIEIVSNVQHGDDDEVFN